MPDPAVPMRRDVPPLPATLAALRAEPDRLAAARESALADLAATATTHAASVAPLARATAHARESTLQGALDSARRLSDALRGSTSDDIAEDDDDDDLTQLATRARDIGRRATQLATLARHEPAMSVLLGVPRIVTAAIDAARPTPAGPPAGLVDDTLTLVAHVAALDRGVHGAPTPSAPRALTDPSLDHAENIHQLARRASLAVVEHASVSRRGSLISRPSSPQARPNRTVARVAAATRTLADDQLTSQLVAYLSAPPGSQSLPALLRAVTYLRRHAGPQAAGIESEWARAYLGARMAGPPLPDEFHGTDVQQPEILVAAATAWLDAVRAHLYDTAAQYRVLFPSHALLLMDAVHVLAARVAAVLADAIYPRLPSDAEIVAVARHARAVLTGASLARAGIDLGVHVAQSTDLARARRAGAIIQAAADRAAAELVDEVAGSGNDWTMSSTWAGTSRAIAQFAATTIDVFADLGAGGLPVRGMQELAEAVRDAVARVDEAVLQEALGDARAKMWKEVVAPHVRASWAAVVRAAAAGVPDQRCGQGGEGVEEDGEAGSRVEKPRRRRRVPGKVVDALLAWPSVEDSAVGSPPSMTVPAVSLTVPVA
ncbi:hypothetical protein AMAG_15247 [Allomyces macrogynus ATCC 38327]|uniref:Uncharacterized protein n=1 Tax=Allomyces macrogynus (strain ATCC 38327) TaxID=578462 RepID=A0A0L0T876_ALLM3|nr:hypothetical protein AMAG_15247 [Allomyces macrogynus ATCC 38327]|eukprot:KNE70988.1 hypothetical protein AMAG_15247 [Allomyces macrogynus ATCC 38327]